MDAKITLSFDEEVINKAKKFAAEHEMSLSRMTENFYRHVTNKHYKHFEDVPIAGWVKKLAVGKPIYVKKRRTRKELKKEFYESRIR